MSAYGIIASKKYTMIASDTLAYILDDNDEACPASFSDKVVMYPHLKTMVLGVGRSRISQDLFLFIRNHTLCKGFDDLIETINVHFMDFIDLEKYDLKEIGSKGRNGEMLDTAGDLSFHGLSENTNEIRSVSFCIKSDGSIRMDEYDLSHPTYQFHPEPKDEKIAAEIMSNVSLSNVGRLTECFKLMHSEYLNEETRTVAMGGDLVMNIMEITENGDFYMQTIIPYRFENYGNDYERMLELNKGKKRKFSERIDRIKSSLITN